MASNLLGQFQRAAAKPIPTFEYQPLERATVIRIVILQHGFGNDPIECRLLHTELGQKHYEALSYEWGPPSHNDPTIVLDGFDIQVRKNLRDALTQIRLEEEDRYIWIDALCIDQANVHERNHQVQLMGRIYRGARKVIVWLGPAKDNSDFAIEMTERINELTVENITQYRAALLALCQRSYWRRVWITQEIHLARNYIIHCGRKSISDTAFDHAIAPTTIERSFGVIDVYRDQILVSAASNHMMPRRIHAYHNTLQMWIRLCIYSNLVCTEPRDIIYAMLGIASDCQNGELIPDYGKPLLEVYLEAIALCKQHKESVHGFALTLAGKLGLTDNKNIHRLISEIDKRGDKSKTRLSNDEGKRGLERRSDKIGKRQSSGKKWLRDFLKLCWIK
ncbi:hypothetical protein BP6252_02924 [Coleophoma cylindrospora]|uniref:Heterokaryon incompatibility domain-containing protein n=1 Tax=Coleophoma cylindrospora TaxID=1849047 RepID=A0A3D8SGR0_9HELO|nr:hypothetical protein BP6252_02924 [Coleophoma cylindrospora]